MMMRGMGGVGWFGRGSDWARQARAVRVAPVQLSAPPEKFCVQPDHPDAPGPHARRYPHLAARDGMGVLSKQKN